MSAAHSLPPEYGLAGLRMRADEYLAIGETQERYELIDGVVVMSPSPRPRHWKVLHEIARQFDAFVERGGVADVYGETDLKLHDMAVFRPDLCVFVRPTPKPFPDRLTEAPDLVVEILSPGAEARDFITKRDEYEKRGVKEYWVIDPNGGRVRAWHLERSRLVESLVEGDSLASAGVPGFTLDLGRIVRLVSGA
jgi:Uma2 family endonuclease